MTTIYIYSLRESGIVRYVGLSSSPRRRLAAHLSVRSWRPVSAWLYELGVRDSGPEMQIEDSVTCADQSEATQRARAYEREHIASHGQRHTLLNDYEFWAAQSDVPTPFLTRFFHLINARAFGSQDPLVETELSMLSANFPTLDIGDYQRFRRNGAPPYAIDDFRFFPWQYHAFGSDPWTDRLVLRRIHRGD